MKARERKKEREREIERMIGKERCRLIDTERKREREI